MNYISEVSCIIFDLNPTDPTKYVLISRGPACASEVGRQAERTGRKEQSMMVGEHCSVGNLVHEFLHVLGFLHMHTATNRDDYVTINWKNVNPQAMKNFEKITTHVSMFNTQYDYRSIMHYSPKAFAVKKGTKTIYSIEPISAMGQRQGMTEGDITRLNRMYKCPKWMDQDLGNQEFENEQKKEDFSRNQDSMKEQQTVDEIKPSSRSDLSYGPPTQQIIVAQPAQQIIEPNNKLSSLVEYLTSAIDTLNSVVAPLSSVQEKLKNLVATIEKRSGTWGAFL